jgi:hypothetical protein
MDFHRSPNTFLPGNVVTCDTIGIREMVGGVRTGAKKGAERSIEYGSAIHREPG